MIQDNYYHRRGITIKACKRVCKQLGLNPCVWSHLSTAFEILKTKHALK